MKQETALGLMKKGKNVFITGSAGTGKTYLLRQYVEWLENRGKAVHIIAPTGMAAYNAGGKTIHSQFSLGINKFDFIQYRLKLNSYKIKAMEKIKILIFDEISMVSAEMLSIINQILQWIHVSDKPFGGIQVILVGDFFQLPPVMKDKKTTKKFAWQSDAWEKNTFTTCYLTKKYRQSEEDPLVTVLDAIRSNEVDNSIISLLEGMQSGRDGVKLYTTNHSVDYINQTELRQIDSAPHFYKAEMAGKDYEQEKFFKNSPWVENLELKVGAKVMFVTNDMAGQYVNGSTGVIVSITGGIPVVRLNDDNSMVVAGRVEVTNRDSGGKLIVGINQIPLRLAWAITIHKSQGMTLDAVEIDLTKAFEEGQGYVALSRCKSYDGIKLIGWNLTALKVHPWSLILDPRMRKASEKAELEYEKGLK